MEYARIAIVDALTSASGATVVGSGELECDSFDARLWIFEKATQHEPPSLSARAISDQSFKVLNPSLDPVLEGSRVQVGQLVDKRWVVISGGGGGVSCDFVRFEVIRELTEEENTTGVPGLLAQALAAPCGCGNIPGVDEYGYIEIFDFIGCFVDEGIDYVGQKGYAKYMQPLDGTEYDECMWEIVSLCCATEEVALVTSLGLGDNGTEYDDATEECLVATRVYVRTCPREAPPQEICGTICVEDPCPDGYEDY